MTTITAAFPTFLDLGGDPLDQGYIYVGEPNQNPQTTPKQVYWDAALTIPAAQPIRTLAGYIVRNGSPANLYVNGQYSITVRNRGAALVYTKAIGNELLQSAGASEIGINDGASGSLFTTVQGWLDYLKSSAGASIVGFVQSGVGASKQWIQNLLRERVSLSSYVPDGANVETADCTPYLLAAITAHPGKEVEIPYAKIRLASPFVWDTTGDGVVEAPKIAGLRGKRGCEIVNATGGVAMTFTSGPSNTDFMYGLSLRGFTITNPSGTGSKGVVLTGVFKSRVNVRVVNQTSHGIHLLSTVGDAEDCSQIDLRGTETQDNGGDGIRAEGLTDGIHSQIWADEGRHIGNGGLAVRFLSAMQSTVRKNAIAYNLGGGVFVGRNPGQNYSKSPVVEDNEFDSNGGVQVDFGAAIGGCERRNTYICNPDSPAVSVNVRMRSEAINIISDQAQPRIGSGITGVTMFDVDAASSAVQIQNAEFASWLDAGNTRYANDARNCVQGLAESYSITVSAFTNLDASPTVNIGQRIRVGNRVFCDVQFTGDPVSTGGVSITFNAPVDAIAADAAFTGAAVEINSITVGAIFDATSGDATSIVMWFPSLASGTRTMRGTFSFNVAP